ncbi:hypothetical protein Brsp07_04635 [Brucella sp. NBRC 14130]|uniref:hypothetical protein n=1 Tax=Brucella sp. NBRC 14130 TaxID=3075483 RepID=UPI0030A910E3
MKTFTLKKPYTARHAVTIGDLERLAGIEQSHDARFAFWVQFAPLKDGAFDAGRAELYRRIETRSQGDNEGDTP